MSEHYGTLVEANQFFAGRLHAFDWENALVGDRTKAMSQATELIDQLDFAGYKAAVQEYLDGLECPDVDDEDVQAGMKAASLTQELEFPRGDDADVPVEIEKACYLIAKVLLSGRDPEADLEALTLKSTGFGDLKSTRDPVGNFHQHLTHMIPSPQAWNLLKPFLRERTAFNVKRV